MDWVYNKLGNVLLKKYHSLFWLLRYHLYSLAFQTWRTYVNQRRAMKDKYSRAEDHGKKWKRTSKGNPQIDFSL